MTDIVLAIDPGPSKSAYVLYGNPRVLGKGIVDNEDLLKFIYNGRWAGTPVVFEQVAGMGKTVGKAVFETVFWTGRLFQAAKTVSPSVGRITRGAVKMHVLGQIKGGDVQVRNALIVRFGGNRFAKGTAKDPGPLYGVSSHMWSALALAVTWSDRARGCFSCEEEEETETPCLTFS